MLVHYCKKKKNHAPFWKQLHARVAETGRLVEAAAAAASSAGELSMKACSSVLLLKLL